MALIKCNECGKEISDKANSCPNCGNPINEDKSVKILFPQDPTGPGLLYDPENCTISNENGEILAKCRRGEIAIFKIEEPTRVTIKMGAGYGKFSGIAEPGSRYKVNIRSFGRLSVSKVDIL